ncbi:MAG: transglutaminase family protein [Clostridia bacterium]|nr:transglutaminase family protein [Clostridia bacterium]
MLPAVSDMELKKYLESTEYVDFDNPEVKKLAEKLREENNNDTDLIKNTYHFVRDNIHHSWDVQDKRVTVSASDVLREGVGICWAKANLLAALLRANGIPAGFSYQRLTLGDTPDTGYCIHALNTVYIHSLEKWIRLDARGNKEGVNAQFSLEGEKLAFEIKSVGEIDYHNNHAKPDESLMQVLKISVDAIDMYLHHLPDKLGYE